MLTAIGIIYMLQDSIILQDEEKDRSIDHNLLTEKQMIIYPIQISLDFIRE